MSARWPGRFTSSAAAASIWWTRSARLLHGDRDALALVSDSYAHQPDWVALPVSRCGEAFFELRTRILGDVAQKLVNYGLRLAIVGDVAPFVAASSALRDFVRESNRGGQIWFVANLAELRERLEAQG